MWASVYTLLAKELEKLSGLLVEIEPQVATPNVPHLRIKPKTPKVVQGGQLANKLGEKQFIELHFEVWFIAFGGGIEFLDKVMDLSITLNEKLKTLNLKFADNYGIAVVFEKLQDGEFFDNEEEGSKPYIWLEKWKGKMIVRRGKIKQDIS